MPHSPALRKLYINNMLAIHFVSFPLLCWKEQNKPDCEFNVNFSQIKIMKKKRKDRQKLLKQNKIFIAPESS